MSQNPINDIIDRAFQLNEAYFENIKETNIFSIKAYLCVEKSCLTIDLKKLIVKHLIAGDFEVAI